MVRPNNVPQPRELNKRRVVTTMYELVLARLLRKRLGKHMRLSCGIF